MIQTSSYALSPKMYFKILAENRLRRFWWLYLLMILFSISLLDKFGNDDLVTVYILLSVFYIPGIFLYLYYFAHSKKNSVLYLSHFLKINEDKIMATIEDDIHNEIPVRYIIKAVERKTYWLLYIAKSQFLYIPKAVFPNLEAQAEFKIILSESQSIRL